MYAWEEAIKHVQDEFAALYINIYKSLLNLPLINYFCKTGEICILNNQLNQVQYIVQRQHIHEWKIVLFLLMHTYDS